MILKANHWYTFTYDSGEVILRKIPSGQDMTCDLNWVEVDEVYFTEKGKNLSHAKKGSVVMRKASKVLYEVLYVSETGADLRKVYEDSESHPRSITVKSYYFSSYALIS